MHIKLKLNKLSHKRECCHTKYHHGVMRSWAWGRSPSAEDLQTLLRPILTVTVNNKTNSTNAPDWPLLIRQLSQRKCHLCYFLAAEIATNFIFILFLLQLQSRNFHLKLKAGQLYGCCSLIVFAWQLDTNVKTGSYTTTLHNGSYTEPFLHGPSVGILYISIHGMPLLNSEFLFGANCCIHNWSFARAYIH